MSSEEISKHLARRLDGIEPFHVMAILARARELEAQGKKIIHMEVGEPDFDTPPSIIEAGINALSRGKTHYTPAVGLPELRQAIAGFYQSRYNTHVDWEQVVVTPGASGALMLVLASIINPGDQVLMADPGYPCNRHFVRFLEGEPVCVPVDASSRYQLTADLAQQHWSDKTAAVMVASPSNPTGTVLSRAEIQDLVELVEQRNAYLIVDEIYHGLVYDTLTQTSANLSQRVLVINSFSKYFSMTGWRLGWLVGPQHLLSSVDKLAQNIFLAPPTVAQHAALAAFSPETLALLENRVAEFKQRRDFLLPGLQDLGFKIPYKPEGAFYLYANCESLSQDSFQFCRQLLEQAGVAVTPGIDFGQNQANTHIRFSYTTHLENLRQGIESIKSYIN